MQTEEEMAAATDAIIDSCPERPMRHISGVYQERNGELTNGKSSGSFEPIKLRYLNLPIDADPKKHVIKNVIAEGEISSWIGPPGAGKSGLLTDAAVALSSLDGWRGYRIREPRATLYFALERGWLVVRRVSAYQLRNGTSGFAIALAEQLIDVMDKNCVPAIVDAINRTENEFYMEVGLVVIDTWPKAVAAGGGDENLARDQHIAGANLHRVLEKCSRVHIATIGHTGKDPSRGERGSNARLADVDMEVLFDGSETKTATITKGNDQELNQLTSFCFQRVVLGIDDDGDEFATHIISNENIVPPLRTKNDSKKERFEAKLNNALVALASCDTIPLHPECGLMGVPHGCSIPAWREELLSRNVIDRKGANPRKEFFRLANQLMDKKQIAMRGDFVWRVL